MFLTILFVLYISAMFTDFCTLSFETLDSNAAGHARDLMC